MAREASQEQIHGQDRGAGANATDGIHVGLFAVEVVDDVLLRIGVDCDETGGVAVERDLPLDSLDPTRGVCRNYRSTAACHHADETISSSRSVCPDADSRSSPFPPHLRRTPSHGIVVEPSPRAQHPKVEHRGAWLLIVRRASILKRSRSPFRATLSLDAFQCRSSQQLREELSAPHGVAGLTRSASCRLSASSPARRVLGITRLS